VGEGLLENAMQIPIDQFTQTLNRFLIDTLAPNFEDVWAKIAIGAAAGAGLLDAKIKTGLSFIGASDGSLVDLDLLQKMVYGSFETQSAIPVVELIKPFLPENMERFIKDEGLSLAKADAEELFRRLGVKSTGEQA
jgi:hypothetical protein